MDIELKIFSFLFSKNKFCFKNKNPDTTSSGVSTKYPYKIRFELFLQRIELRLLSVVSYPSAIQCCNITLNLSITRPRDQ